MSSANLNPADWAWPFWPLVPLYPRGHRRTLRTEVVKDTVWTFDQIQGIFYVAVPIRMTVIRSETGGLLVYAPVAPTKECIRLVRELEASHGPVKFIILPTISGLEHKVFVGPFARCFPEAQVFIAPKQWSFPLNLPISWLGLPAHRTQVLPADSRQVAFAGEFDYAPLGPIGLGLGSFGEVALLHRPSKTLLVTDSVVSIPADPPAIAQLDPYPLLFHARDSGLEPLSDTEANRRKGWQRTCLFAFYFRPSVLNVVDLGPSLREAAKAPDRSHKALFGWYPFHWQENWQQAFEQLRRGGRLLVAPILQTLILNRAPQETITWADRVASWDFYQIIPCHLDAPIRVDRGEFRQAFAFLEKSATSNHPALLPDADLAFLRELEQSLNRARITPPAQEKV